MNARRNTTDVAGGSVGNATHAAGDAALKVVGLSKIFSSPAGPVAVLVNVNFTILRGELVSIIGPSGSGKSTLLNMIGALDRPTSGKVLIGGLDIFSLTDPEIAIVRNKMIGFIFQSYNLINRSSVQRNVELSSIIAAWTGRSGPCAL